MHIELGENETFTWNRDTESRAGKRPTGMVLLSERERERESRQSELLASQLKLHQPKKDQHRSDLLLLLLLLLLPTEFFQHTVWVAVVLTA